MVSALAFAAKNNAGYVYMTDDLYASNPWNSLPAYFEQEVTEMQKYQQPNLELRK